MIATHANQATAKPVCCGIFGWSHGDIYHHASLYLEPNTARIHRLLCSSSAQCDAADDSIHLKTPIT